MPVLVIADHTQGCSTILSIANRTYLWFQVKIYINFLDLNAFRAGKSSSTFKKLLFLVIVNLNIYGFLLTSRKSVYLFSTFQLYLQCPQVLKRPLKQ